MKHTKKIAFSAILAALAVVFLYAGALLDVMDLSAAGAASLCVMLVLYELGTRYAVLTYAAVGLLSLLILPQKTGSILFIGFLGFYPIAKMQIEKRLSRPFRTVAKFLLLNVCTVVLIFVIEALTAADTWWFRLLLLVMSNVVFAVYDYALTVLLRAYVYKWRKKFKIKF